jgi:hypothetical protein
MRSWWPFFDPWPQNKSVRRAIKVGFVVAGCAEVGIVSVGPSLTWLAIGIAIVLWAILVIALLIERPKRRTRASHEKPSRTGK